MSGLLGGSGLIGEDSLIGGDGGKGYGTVVGDTSDTGIPLGLGTLTLTGLQLTTSVEAETGIPLGLGALTLTGLQPTTSTAWLPSDLSTDLLLWLDAQTASSVVEVDSQVSQWSDLSGNDRHVTQTSASVRPTYSSSTYGSCISYAAGDQLNIPTGAIAALSPETFVIVGLCNFGTSGVADRNVYYNGQNSDTTASGQQMQAYSTDDLYMYDAYDGNSYTYIASDPINTSMDSIFSEYHNGTSYIKRQYGAQFDSDTTSGTYNTATEFLNAVGSVNFDGDIYAFIIANYTSAADVERLEGYICHRYGAEALLDASHPYRYEAP